MELLVVFVVVVAVISSTDVPLTACSSYARRSFW